MNRDRLRVLLLLAVGLTIVALGSFWPKTVGLVRQQGHESPRTTAAGDSDASADSASGAAERPPLSDSEFTRITQGYGLLVNTRNAYLKGENLDTAAFYFASLTDSTRSLGDLGFIQGVALLDSAAQLVPAGPSGALPNVVIGAPRFVEQRLRRPAACSEEIKAPVRALSESSELWTIGLAGAQQLPGRWVSRPVDELDSATIKEALLLGASIPFSPADGDRAAEIDRNSGRTPLGIDSYHRLIIDGTEIIVADLRRTVDAPQPMREQRLLIAERDPRNPSANFQVAWYFFNAADPGESSTEVPTLLLRLGRERLLTLYTDGHHRGGLGGRFVSRVGPGQWKEVASWSGGC